MRILSIGEILWDVISGHEYLGGAPFNFAAHAVRLRHQVKFISAVGLDARGALAREKAHELGIETDLLLETTQAETGISRISLNAAGEATHQLPRPAAYDFVALSEEQMNRIVQWSPEWIYYGTLLQMSDQARRLTNRLCGANPRAKRFYDVNLRKGQYSAELVRELLALATIVKLNDDEVHPISDIAGIAPETRLDGFCRAFATLYPVDAVCVTEGARGCTVLRRDPPALVQAPGYAVAVADTVGAGDAFSAAFVHGWSLGWPLERICDFANRVGAVVTSRSGATPKWSEAEALALN